MFMIARRQPPVKQNPQSFLHCRKIAENRRKTQKRCKFNLQIGCGLDRQNDLECAPRSAGGSYCLPQACRDAPLGQRQGGVFRLPPPYLWTPPTPQCNNCDRRQWRKQGGVVGAAASKTRVPPNARCGCWVPQPDSGAHSKSSALCKRR